MSDSRRIPCRCPGLLRGFTTRIVVALSVLALSGLLAATLVRMAAGFGTV